MFAVWYLFDNDDADYLSEIIKDLAKKYHAPTFFPHITAYGLLDIDLKTLDEIILGAIQEVKPFIVEKNIIDFSYNIWKTIFIEILPNNQLIKINNNLTQQLSQFIKYEFLPHVSLLYKNLETSPKQFLANNLDIKKNFRIIGMGVQQFSEKIEEWKLVRKYQFDKIH